MNVAGIDVGARRLDAVAVDDEGRVLDSVVVPAADVEGLVAWVRGAGAVAVDAPDAWSTAPHAGDEDLAPKFRSARCAEIGLGRVEGIWVPWTTPVEAAPGTWIDVGVCLFAALRDAGHRPLEVFPHATFRVLGGGRRPPQKQTVEGVRTRAALLRAAGVSAPAMASWGHDALDAASAALVALHHARGTARAVTCGHDGSAIWLPPPFSGAETTE
jgi:predicted nuclease with RNAse H fold